MNEFRQLSALMARYGDYDVGRDGADYYIGYPDDGGHMMHYYSFVGWGEANSRLRAVIKGDDSFMVTGTYYSFLDAYDDEVSAHQTRCEVARLRAEAASARVDWMTEGF